MTQLQRDFSKSRIAKRLCKEWILLDGGNPKDKELLEKYLAKCAEMTDDQITVELILVYDNYTSTKERDHAMDILRGYKTLEGDFYD